MAIAQMLVRFNWTWVGIIRGDHEYGRFAVQGLLRELQGTGVCVAYQEMIPLLYNRQKALEIMKVLYVDHRLFGQCASFMILMVVLSMRLFFFFRNRDISTHIFVNEAHFH